MLHCNNNVIYNTVEVLNEGPRSKLLHKEIDMFTTDFYIDTVQSGKKTFVNTFVQHEAVKLTAKRHTPNQWPKSPQT